MRPVYLLYARDKPSIKMRCLQLAEVLSKQYEVKLYRVENPEVANIKNGIIYFFKHILANIKKVNFYEFKQNNNVLVFDTIDLTRGGETHSTFEKEFYKNFDYVITPLIVLYNLNKNLSKAKYIPHHYDLELNNLKTNPNKINKILYMGNNWYIKGYMDILDKVEKCSGFPTFMNNINFYSSFKYHISFYDNSVIDSIYKPITKVATAAALDAIIICENSEENIYWLGNDYPFYIDMKNKTETIKYWIDRVEKNNIEESLIEKAKNKMIILKEKLNLINIVKDYHLPLIQEINNRRDDSFVQVPNIKVKKEKKKLKEEIKEKKIKQKETKDKNGGMQKDVEILNSVDGLNALKKLDIPDADKNLARWIKSMKKTNKFVLSDDESNNVLVIKKLKKIMRNEFS